MYVIPEVPSQLESSGQAKRESSSDREGIAGWGCKQLTTYPEAYYGKLLCFAQCVHGQAFLGTQTQSGAVTLHARS